MFIPKGHFAWYELITSDTQVAGKFYSEVVGWTTREMPSSDGPAYTIFNQAGAGMAGMLAQPGHTAWVGFITVDDVDAHVEEIVKAGGKQLRPPQDVPGMLRFTVVADPQGAAFVVFTPAGPMDAQSLPQPPAPGTFGWSELYTTQLDAGFDFYRQMFGWTKTTDMDMGPMGVYRIFDEGKHHAMGDGGMMLKTPNIPAPCWGFYICVDSIKAAQVRVESGGGKIVYGPAQIPGGGWILQGMDPLGAMFALTSGAE